MSFSTRELRMMGTVIQLSVEHDNPEMIFKKLVERLYECNQRFSIHDSNSELMKINKSAGITPVEVNPHLYELIKIGKEHSTANHSSLNIAIGPLVRAWRIGFKNAEQPSEKSIQSFLTKINADDIILDEKLQTVFLNQRDMFIDLGALAKGFIADLIIEDLKEMNVSAALINLGGNVVTHGKSPKHHDGLWHIGIQHPFLPRGNHMAMVKVLNQSVVTSGIYERNSTINDRTYHHILDPNSGYPIETEIASLTVISKESIDGEIWTGRLFGQSINQIMDTLDKLNEIEGIVITKSGELLHSSSLTPYLSQSLS